MGCKQNRNTANYCGRKQLPTLRTPLGQIRDAEQSAAERVLTAWSTTPPGASERATRAERGFPSANKDSPTTWILQYPAPSRGSCREAEGVALHPQKFSHAAPPSRPNSRRGAKRSGVRAHCVEHYPSGGAGASHASGEGLPIGPARPQPQAQKSVTKNPPRKAVIP